MNFELPPDDDPRRQAVRAWLEQHPDPSGRVLADAGYVAPHWPAPWGLGADPEHQLIIDEELRRARVRRPENRIGIGWAGPTLIHAGSLEQQQRYLPPLLSGDEVWCQLFSEPGAGSDLASLTTRAERDGDEWVINGQKIWTSLAQFSSFGILLARTGGPVGSSALGRDATKQQGITYFICPMDADGVEVRPITEMTGSAMFNEVFLTDVRLPHANVVGEVHKGWPLAKVTLGNERVSLSGEGALWGMGPTAGDLLATIKAGPPVEDPVLRQRVAQVHIEAEILRLIRLRTVSAAIHGQAPGPEASVRKVLADEHGQHVMALAKDLTGPAGMLGFTSQDRAMWDFGYLFAPALTIGGGTGEVQRNIIAERVLDLPRELDATDPR